MQVGHYPVKVMIIRVLGIKWPIIVWPLHNMHLTPMLGTFRYCSKELVLRFSHKIKGIIIFIATSQETSHTQTVCSSSGRRLHRKPISSHCLVSVQFVPPSKTKVAEQGSVWLPSSEQHQIVGYPGRRSSVLNN
jgi:hypothetical protein